MSALRDSPKRLQIEFNNRPIRDADSKNVFTLYIFVLSTLTENIY
jgi:hypothetical protein